VTASHGLRYRVAVSADPSSNELEKCLTTLTVCPVLLICHPARHIYCQVAAYKMVPSGSMEGVLAISLLLFGECRPPARLSYANLIRCPSVPSSSIHYQSIQSCISIFLKGCDGVVVAHDDRVGHDRCYPFVVQSEAPFSAVKSNLKTESSHICYPQDLLSFHIWEC
jgi:hypothetical protein